MGFSTNPFLRSARTVSNDDTNALLHKALVHDPTNNRFFAIDRVSFDTVVGGRQSVICDVMIRAAGAQHIDTVGIPLDERMLQNTQANGAHG